jgi:HEAT repeat protein
MLTKWSRVFFVGLALGIAALVYIYDSPQTSEPVCLGSKQTAKKPLSEGSGIGAPAPLQPSTALSTGKSYQLPADGPSPYSGTQQPKQTDAAAPGDQNSDSDSNDYYGEELFENWELALLDSNSEVRREAAENTVAQRNDAAFEVLSGALQDREAQNRVAAIDSLGRLLSEGAADEEQLLGLLLEATNDRDPEVADTAKLLVQERFQSLTQSKLTPDQLLADETPAGSDPEQDLNEAAASGDQYFDSDSNDDHGEELLENWQIALIDPDSEVRREVAEHAVALRDDAALEVLSESLQDREALNRVAAIDRLGRLLSEGAADEEHVLRLLSEATNDYDPDVAHTAKLLLQDRFESQISFKAEKEYWQNR